MKISRLVQRNFGVRHEYPGSKPIAAGTRAAPQDHALLAEALLESLQDHPKSDVDAAWDVEIKRRLEQVNNRTAKLIASEEVHSQACRLYR